MNADQDPIRVIALVGPTASGKSAVAMELAPRLPAEIVVADSMQVYRGMDIGTSKPSATDRASVSHHMLDVADIDEAFSAGRYQSLARQAVSEIDARGAVPLVVGGSGLYLRALLDDLEFAPGSADSDVRVDLEERCRREGPDALHRQLEELDPMAAQAIDSRNARRVIRALEGIYSTGELWSARLAGWRNRRPVYSCLTVGISLDRADLYASIDARVDQMMAAGWLDEVRALLEKGLAEAPTARRALGYRQLIAHESGSTSLDQAVAETKRATRAFAKRQLTWFRADPTIQWLEAGNRSVAELARDVRGMAERHLGGRRD